MTPAVTNSSKGQETSCYTAITSALRQQKPLGPCDKSAQVTSYSQLFFV